MLAAPGRPAGRVGVEPLADPADTAQAEATNDANEEEAGIHIW